jgi:hypothetical protein
MKGHIILDEVWYTDLLIQAGNVQADFGSISVSYYGNNSKFTQHNSLNHMCTLQSVNLGTNFQNNTCYYYKVWNHELQGTVKIGSFKQAFIIPCYFSYIVSCKNLVYKSQVVEIYNICEVICYLRKGLC